MAEWIVNFVLGKFADVAVHKVLRFYGVDKQVETMSRELGWIQAFLKDADKKQITDETQKHWVTEVRDLAYSIEDVIDTFLIEVPQEPQTSAGLMERMTKKAKKLTVVDKFVDEISQIQKRITEIEERKIRYGMDNLGEDSGDIILPIKPFVLPDIDPEVIGLNKDRDYIVKELLNETTKRRYVVSIWGAGGLGKTTLAQKVYNSNDVKERFGLRIWVVISQKFQLIDILRKIMEQIDRSKQPKDEEAFLITIHESLRGKTYLIILDDVWTDDLWIQVEPALPNENNESRVLITTRSFDVAKDADPACEPYKLDYLTKELSLELLLKKSLPNQDPNNSAFHGLSDIINQFVHKCSGLPLALVIVGGLLSKKPRNYTAWSKVLKTMSWHDDGKKCSEIIGTSYEDLPFALKSCFMYFAAFPEDYEVEAPDLIRLWVAEGFIPQEDNRTLEETAESFLEDLVQRSMVHVKSRSITDGSIEVCYIHDLLRDLAVRKAKEDKFLVVYSHPNDQRSMSGARRVAVHHLDGDELVMSQNLRTLLNFNNENMPNCSKQRLLKVVRTESSSNITKIKLEMFEELTQLRYLNLYGVSIDKSEEWLEKVIGAMKFLQTLIFQIMKCTEDGHVEDGHVVCDLITPLDCRHVFISMIIPLDCIWHINTLRHVSAFLPLEVPSSAKLTNLQTLKWVCIKESWKTELPHLPNLRCLTLHQESSYPWGGVVAFLRTLEHLTVLRISGSFIPLDIIDMRGFPFYQQLQSLELCNVYGGETSNEMAIDVSMFAPHLTYLRFDYFRFHQDVMSVLEKLPCLKMLYLTDRAFTNGKISCSAKGFSQLEVLMLDGFHLLEEWEIEEGAMPILKELIISYCSQLCVPQGLPHLTSLQTLKWWCSGRGREKDEISNLLKDVVPSNVKIDVVM